MKRVTFLAWALILAGCDANPLAEREDRSTREAPPPAEPVPEPRTAEPAPDPTTAPAPQASVTPSASAPTKRAETAPVPTAEPTDASPKERVDTEHRVQIEGTPIQGGLVLVKLDKKPKRANMPGHRIVVADDGRFLIGFSRTAPEKETLTLAFDDGVVLERVFEVGQRTFTPETVDVPDEEAEVAPEDKRSKALADARIEAARMKWSKDACYDKGFEWPVKGKITSRYGFPRILNGKEAGVHWGIDLAVPVGTKVKAPACGTVVFAEADVPLSGTTLIIDHGHGLTSTFLHLSKIDKKVGDRVEKGEVVARSGNTGRSTGPHLDWRMNVFGIRIDPELLLPAGGRS